MPSISRYSITALGSLTGGLYHLLNHSSFKACCFWARQHLVPHRSRDIEKLGGIGKRMPVISIAMLVGLMAMAALPPLNGFCRRVGDLSVLLQIRATAAFVGRSLRDRCWRLARRLPRAGGGCVWRKFTA
ncbi:hypothetical protein KCP70_05435 [Salmonella enterica subsp. enterica]|nr:hypothetical protein KCP70_05435 [Salmonella enterica subsp. enterica]